MADTRISCVTATSVAAAAFLAIGLASVTQAQAAPPRFFFEGDTVRGVPPTGPTGAPCVLSSQFKHGELVVWRVRVLDGKTGKPVDASGLKSLVVDLSSGQKVTMRFHPHPNRGPQTDHYWSAAWYVPDNYPTGSFGYKIVAIDEQGHATDWQPFQIASTQLTVIPGPIEPFPPHK